MKHVFLFLFLLLSISLFSQKVYFSSFSFSNSYDTIDNVRVVDTIYIKFKINYDKKKSVFDQINYIYISMGYYKDTIKIPIEYQLFIKKNMKGLYYESMFDSTNIHYIKNNYSTIKTCIKELKIPKIKYAFFSTCLKDKFKYIYEEQREYIYGVLYSKLQKDLEKIKHIPKSGYYYAQ